MADGDKVNLESFRACASIQSDTARLACFDKAAKGFDFDKADAKLAEAEELKRETARLKAEAKAEAEHKQAEQKRLAAEEKARADAEAKRIAELEAQKREEFGKRASELEEKDELTTLSSAITRTLKPQVGGLVVFLGNSQVWQIIDSKRPGPMKTGTKVRIEKSFAGGFFMINEDTGRSVRVKRLN